jgi:peptidoglycan biosynthesis protein MviN/MurJ (putative lipid II flippase)
MQSSSDDAVTGSALSRRLLRVHANHKKIAAGAVTIAVLTVIAKALVAVREMAIAWRYGVSGIVDAYQLSLTIVTWVPVMLTAIMSVVLVPRLVMLDRRKPARDQFVSEFNGTVLVVGIGIALLTYLSAPWAARLMASGLGTQTLHLTAAMIQRLAPVSLFMIVTGYFTARLQARERFSYTVTEAVPALMIALLVLTPFAGHSAAPLILGALIGYLAQALILSRLVATGDPPLGKLSLRHRSEEWGTFYRSILMMTLGQMVLTVTNPIDQAFAARLGEGSVATLGYATRIVTLFSGLATVVIGRALLPVLSNSIADGAIDVGRRQAIQWAWLMVGSAVLGSILLWLVAPVMVALLFERGAFDARAAASVSAVIRFGVVQLPFFFGGIALVQWIAARGSYSTLLWIACAALVAKVLLNFLLVQRLGLGGLMLATAGMYALSFALQLYVSSRS